MERTVPPKKQPVKLPDAINSSISRDFTQVPNQILRNPEMSGKAKALIALLLSNKEGWTSHITTLQQMMKEGEEAIRSGLRELEDFGYLIRVRYRSKKTGEIKGSFWAYSDVPYQFMMEETIDHLAKQGFELVEMDLPFDPHRGDPHRVNPHRVDRPLKRRNFNKTNEKDDHCSESNLADQKSSTQERTENFLSQAEKLAKMVQSTKRINIPSSKVKTWADEIRKINEIEGVELSRIDAVLDWYFYHIGGEFIPVVESGYSLREKFIRLEAAMERSNNGNGSKKPDPSGSRLPSHTPKYHARG